MSDTDIKSVSKAAAEASKFGTQAVKTTEKILSFIAKVFREPIEETSGIVGDSLKLMRWKRQVRIVDEVNRILQERGVTDTVAVPPKIALPIFHNATLEEDDTLQDLWIRLLANSMDPEFKEEIRYAYIEVLKSLNPIDVKLLDTFFNVLEADDRVDFEKITDYSLTKEQIINILDLSENEYMMSVYNLFRVQCMAPAIIKGGVRMGTEPLTIYKGVDAITMTPLGVGLVRASVDASKEE